MLVKMAFYPSERQLRMLGRKTLFSASRKSYRVHRDRSTNAAKEAIEPLINSFCENNAAKRLYFPSSDEQSPPKQQAASNCLQPNHCFRCCTSA